VERHQYFSSQKPLSTAALIANNVSSQTQDHAARSNDTITPSMSHMYRHHTPLDPMSTTYHEQLPTYHPVIPYDHDDRVLSILETLPSLSSLPWGLVPASLAVLLRADRDAASICFLVCWCIVREYADNENCPSISYSCVDS
jgi:hypothetical protein